MAVFRPVELSRIDDPLERVVIWRARSFASRASRTLLIGLLAWPATHDAMALVWAAISIAATFVDARIAAWVIRQPKTARRLALACASHLFASLVFLGLAGVLLANPSPARLAEVSILLCATCLINAMMSGASRLANAILVGPAAGLLVLSPLMARLAGLEIALEDAALLGLAGVIYSAFIVRLAANFDAENRVLRQARDALEQQSDQASRAEREAVAGKNRWRMIFEQSSLPRVCFDASHLHGLAVRLPDQKAPIGDRLRAYLPGVGDIFRRFRLLEANQAAFDLCGARLKSVHFTQDFLDSFCRALNAMEPDGRLPPFEARLMTVDGGLLDVQAHFTMAPEGDSPWGLCMATYVDMTETRRAAHQQQEALRAVEAANRAKGDFLTVIGHEIRTPLNGVLGMAQAMAFDPLPLAQRERLEVIRQSGASLLGLIDDLLDLAKMETGRLEIAEAEFDLRAILTGVHAAYAEEARRRGLELAVSLDPALSPRYRGDAGRVRQVLCNLVSNGLKFTHAGEVRIDLEPGETDQGVRIRVSDTGIGIAADRIPQLFEKFVQADTSMTRLYGGSGLGLAICSRLCEAMRGSISVVSDPGNGSIFTVELPLAASEDRFASDFDPAAQDGALRVLAAEDNPVNQKVLLALLGHIGLEPVIVGDGAQAVEAWESQDWDVILMDVQMPVMDGLSATRAIRAQELARGRPRTPIIAVTANAMPHHVEAFRAAGMDDVVSKPISVAELFAAVSALSPSRPASAEVIPLHRAS